MQDQKQTEAIQMLQIQLENVTKLMLNLSVTVGQLQREVCTYTHTRTPIHLSLSIPLGSIGSDITSVSQVSDRQNYLVLSLVLCLALGLLLCMQCCCSSTNNRSPAIPVSNHYPSPKRYARMYSPDASYTQTFNLSAYFKQKRCFGVRNSGLCSCIT